MSFCQIIKDFELLTKYILCHNILSMKYFDWNEEKNGQLKTERDISFEDVVIAILENRILDIIAHPDLEKYPNQKIFILEVNKYAYLVPFTEDEQKIFFKTIIPSRKATKYYIINRQLNIWNILN